MAYHWIRIPADDLLAARSGWKQNPRQKQQFSAIRTHILVAQSVAPAAIKGPVLQVLYLPPDAELTLGKKLVTVVSHAETFSASISRVVAEKVSAEVASSFGYTLEAGLTPSIKAAGAVNTKLAEEITETLTGAFTGTRSYQVTSTTEIVQSHTIKTSAAGAPQADRRYTMFLTVKVHHWDVFLYRAEVVQVTYRKGGFLFRDLRKNAESAMTNVLMPLGRITFYEPEGVPSITQGEYVPDVPDAALVMVTAPSATAPRGLTPDGASLSSLVRLAFPETDEERAAAAEASAAVKRRHREAEFGWATTRAGAKKKGAKKVTARSVRSFSRPSSARKTAKRSLAAQRKASGRAKPAARARASRPARAGRRR